MSVPMNVCFVRDICKPISFDYNGVVLTVSVYQIDRNIPMIKILSQFGEFQVLGDERMVEYPFIPVFTGIESAIEKDGALVNLSDIRKTINSEDVNTFLNFVESLILTVFEVIE